MWVGPEGMVYCYHIGNITISVLLTQERHGQHVTCSTCRRHTPLNHLPAVPHWRVHAVRDRNSSPRRDVRNTRNRNSSQRRLPLAIMHYLTERKWHLSLPPHSLRSQHGEAESAGQADDSRGVPSAVPP